MQNLIETHNLTKRYGKTLSVNTLNMEVPPGAVYGFLGPNGAGKSTTLKMILGLVKPTAGQVTLFGSALDEKNRIRLLADTGSLIESPSYYGHLTGAENLYIIQTLKGCTKSDVDEVLKIVRLTDARNKLAGHYSLGMKQRLGLAAALLGFPKLLILDEPTNGLDPAGIQEMRELIRSLPTEYGITVVVSSHLLSEIDQMADHVGIIRKGELVYQDTLASLHAHAKEQLALRIDHPAIAADLLRQEGILAEQEEEWLLLPMLEDDLAAKLVRRLLEQNLSLYRMEKRETSLEDIFLTLTGKESSL
ncbi:MAG: ABC transporter ATP-binding protein [Bacteroidales bacterium]|nr:ABC transporter ATP-binding protein [Bacteroidales bacterium]MCM1416936.1 ABC transporter ATP-binding protein [bacterium]MCM1424629.1 ABC transporter ATP-binding protein [bacterium]